MLYNIYYMDRIIYIKNGRIEWSGTFQEIKGRETKKYEKTDSSPKTLSGNEIVKIIKDEDEESGSVKISVYCDYSRYLGVVFFLIILFLIAGIKQTNSGAGDMWLAYWSSPENQEKSFLFFIVVLV